MKYTADNPKLVYTCSDAEEDNFTGVVKDLYGNIAYFENGKRHRTDGPAVIWSDGYKEWVIHGKHHREDGPAIIHSNGNKYWYINGKCHREDGPAIEFVNGGKSWYYNDELYGLNNDFTIESWIKKWQLEIFK